MRRSAKRRAVVPWPTAVVLAVGFTLSGTTRDGWARQAQQPREQWQRAAEVVAAVGAIPGARIADVGCGDGFYTVRLARAVGPQGHVYAVDVNPEALGRLRVRLERESLTNVEVIRGAQDDPRLPGDTLDGVLIVNAYHEMSEHQAMLRHIHEALKPTGRLVLVEPISSRERDESRAGQARRHVIAPSLVEEDLRRSGFDVARLEDPFATPPRDDSTYWLILARPRTARDPGQVQNALQSTFDIRHSAFDIRLVPGVGVEPTRPCGQGILSPIWPLPRSPLKLGGSAGRRGT